MLAQMIPQPLPDVPTVSVTEAATLQDNGARIIDVREAVEFNALRVPDSELRPMSTIQSWFQDLGADEHLLFLCRSGNRSANVVNALIEQAGFTNAWNIAGGIIAWGEAGLDVES